MQAWPYTTDFTSGWWPSQEYARVPHYLTNDTPRADPYLLAWTAARSLLIGHISFIYADYLKPLENCLAFT